MRSAAVVVSCELTNDAAEMSIIQWNQVIQTLAANSPDHPLAICIRHRTSNRSFQYLQTKPIQCLVHLGRENSVVVVEQITMAGSAIEECPELLSCPLRRWMVCYVAMQDSTRANLNRDKYIKYRNVAVTEVKKSHATMALAWFWMNVVHRCPTGCRGRPLCFMYLPTVSHKEVSIGIACEASTSGRILPR